MPQPTEPHPDDLLTSTEVIRLLKISRSTFNRLRREGRLPQPVLETSRTTLRWRRGDLLSIGQERKPRGSVAEQLQLASTHIRAASMQARAAAVHTDTAAGLVHQIADRLVSPSAIAANAAAGRIASPIREVNPNAANDQLPRPRSIPCAETDAGKGPTSPNPSPPM